jgi:glycosyltransferase involved in cell wall biosynthesis
MKASIVMPYWNRAEALANALNRYAAIYKDDGLEVIVVDDGSPEKPIVWSYLPLLVRVITLPEKTAALNPCVPINVGVGLAQNDIVFLTNPEIMHTGNIIDPMIAELKKLGPKGYVAAACFCPRLNAWLCKSDAPPTPGRAKVPAGAGLHFFSCFHKSLFDEIGGFDVEYRNGQGYDDNDFLWKLHSAGAKFSILDDCVVEHSPAPRTVWPRGGLARNRAIFERKWGS